MPLVPYPPLRGTFPSRGRLYVGDSDALVYDALETIFSLSFIPLVPYPPLRGTFPSRGRLCIGDSGTLVNGVLEAISLALFHPAFPIQPPPLRGTSFHRKEGVSTRAPSLGRGCRAQRGGVGFLLGRRSPLLFAFPVWERETRSSARVLVYRLLETISHSLSYR